MIDTDVAEQMRADLLWLADHWTQLEHELAGGGGNALTGMPRGGSSALPINVTISDLMAEIDWRLGSHYCHALLDEADDVTAVPTTPEGRLRLVAQRYGHWATADDATGLALADEAHEARGKVERALTRREPPRYWGDCPTEECAGDLYLPSGVTRGTCRTCGREWTVDEQREHIARRFMDRLMTGSEISRALKVAGHAVKPGTVRKWIERERLTAAGDGLYRFADAVALAERRAS